MCSITKVCRINLNLYSIGINVLMKILDGNGKNSYMIASWNCRRGLVCSNKLPTAKLVEIKSFLYESKLDLLCVIESDIYGEKSTNLARQKLTQAEAEWALSVHGYKVFFPKSWYVHGVARIIIYAKQELKVIVKNESIASSDLPTFTSEISFGQERKTIVSYFYREFTGAVSGLKDKQSQKERLRRQINNWKNLCQSNKDVVILGDANLCAKKWELDDYHEKEIADMVRHFLLTNDLTQTVSEYTRSEIGRGGIVLKSCIDHCYVNSPDKITTNVVHVGDSDHDAVMIKKASRLPRTRPKVIRKRSYNNFNIETFLNDVHTSDINEAVVAETEIDIAAEVFEKKFSEIINHHAKIKTFQQRRNYLPFLSENTKQTMIERKIVLQEAKKQNDPELIKEGKRLGRAIKALIRDDEKRYYDEGLDVKNNPKKAWRNVRMALNVEKNLSPTCIQVSKSENEKELISNPLKLANLFNEYFTDKVNSIRNEAVKKDVTIPPEQRLREWLSKKNIHPPGFSLREITSNDFRTLMKRFKPKRVHGNDWIDAYCLKISAPLIEEALLHLINLSIKSGRFAERWKFTVVFPTFKKGEKELIKNYRPVAHVVQVGKIVEMAVHSQIYGHFETNELFHSNQYGAIKNHSTATAVIHVYEKWLESVEKNWLSASCLIDQTAAYDLLCHQILEKKLEIYQFDNLSRSWINSYLSERSQAVQIESKISDFIKGSDFAIPQGSVLGGLLHVINCNDLPECHEEGDAVVYIDDDTDTVSAPDFELLRSKIQREATNSSDWIKDNRLCVSGDKSKLMVIGTSALRRLKIPHQMSIIIDDKVVNESESERLLGVRMNNNLTWKSHLYGNENGSIVGLIQQLSQRVGVLKRISHKMSSERLKAFAEGIFYSTLKYCLEVFGNVFGLQKYKEKSSRYTAYTISANKDLQVLQNKVNRLLLNKWKDISTEDLCRETGSLSVQQLIANSTLNTALKIIRTGKPSYLASKFVMNERSTAYIQPVRKSISSEGFINRALSLLNKAGPSIFTSISARESKKKVREWVLRNIEIKPKPKVKDMRFSNYPRCEQADQREPRGQHSAQREITDFFSRC